MNSFAGSDARPTSTSIYASLRSNFSMMLSYSCSPCWSPENSNFVHTRNVDSDSHPYVASLHSACCYSSLKPATLKIVYCVYTWSAM